MPVLRPLYVPPLPMDEIRAGRPVRWLHLFRAGLVANALELAGGTVFFNPCHYTLSAVGGTGTSGTFRLRGARRRFGNWCVWVVRYSFDTGTSVGGLLKITPGVAPVNAADEQWATGKRLESRPSGRRYTGELTFFEQVDTGSYTLPGTTDDVTYTLTLTLDTSASTSIRILSVGCYELDRRYLASGAYGVDLGAFGARQPVFSGTTDDMAASIRQVAGVCDRVKLEQPRWLWGHAAESGSVLATSSSHVDSAVFASTVRMHPRRMRRGMPEYIGVDNDIAYEGWSVTPVAFRAYGRNSATVDGRLLITGAYGGASLSGFPIGSYGWRLVNLYIHGESTIADLQGTPTSNGGFQKGLSAGNDTAPEESDMSTLREAHVTFEVHGKSGAGAAANTLDILTIQAVDQYTP